MAFWGIEVKPGKPFSHKFDDSKGRLHVSMASLGLAKATTKSVLQCNVGNKSPVFLCSLYPEKTESLQLNLEFEEVDEVIFSVIGPRSIHLSGYYLGGGGGRYRAMIEESESYGEDIADTDTQRSDCSDEEYEDSFINDEEPEVFPPSPASSDGEESLDNKKPKIGKGNHRRRLRKKYQLSDSDDEGCSRKKSTANGSSAIPGLESEDEDKLPISSCLKGEVAANKGAQDGEENAGTGIDEGGLPTRKSDLPVDKLLTSDLGHKGGGTPKKKRKERSAEGKSHESDRDKEDKTQEGEAKADSNGLKLVAEDGVTQKTVNDSDLPHETDEEPKKKRKKLKNEKKNFAVDSSHLTNAVKENKDQQDEAKDANVIQDPSVRSEQNQNLATEQNHSEEKKVKKKKKKSEAQENGEAGNTDTPPLPIEERNASSMNIESKKPDAKASHIRTLQSGLVIEEVESGKPNGKVASSGKKISVHYVGKLKKNGEIVDSNLDGASYKFRLGAGVVLEGWDVGLEGMRVGEKRRLIVPPSMAYGSEGDGKKIPPNSWLVYEVELVKVR